jgi:hypothetical protein
MAVVFMTLVLDLIRGLASEENFITISNEDGGTSSQPKVRRFTQQNRIYTTVGSISSRQS